jgi:hypothetical protein
VSSDVGRFGPKDAFGAARCCCYEKAFGMVGSKLGLAVLGLRR